MNFKLIVIIILLSLFFYLGFKKIHNFKYENKNLNISQIKILDYLPTNNKLLFISNSEYSRIFNNIKNTLNKENKNDLTLIKNTIFNYLGIDLGKNKIGEIYDNELIISTYKNEKNIKDDILIVFKIKPEKGLDSILNQSNELDEDQIKPILRENKLNYLNYIYRTKDNYVIASSEKLILDFLESKTNKNKKRVYILKKF